MYESTTYLDYELAYRRERMREAATGHREQKGGRAWPTRPRRRHQR